MNRLIRLVCLIVILFMATAFAPSHTASAATVSAAGLSAGCAFLHAGSANVSGVTSFAAQGYTGTFYPGEVIAGTVTVVSGTATFSLNSTPNPVTILVGPVKATATLSYTVGNTPPPGVGVVIQSIAGTVNITLDCAGNTRCSFTDGRLNNCDAGQTAAVYCLADGSVKILAIYKSKGYDALLVTPAEIAKVPSKPSVNTAIKTGNGATLYRLTSGELQVNRAEDGTGKMYSFIFKDCPKP
jgi:hypothetical protein